MCLLYGVIPVFSLQKMTHGRVDAGITMTSITLFFEDLNNPDLYTFLTKCDTMICVPNTEKTLCWHSLVKKKKNPREKD